MVLFVKIFIDSGNLDAIKRLNALGVIDGVTTNPSLVAKEKVDFKTLIKKIAEIVDGPISAETTAKDSTGMVKEAAELSKIHPNIVVKVPMCEEGLKAIKECAKKGIRTNCTLIFSANQALLAAKAGATYVSPFVGRLDDIGQDGMQLVAEIVTIFRNYGIETQVIVASIRHPIHVTQAAMMGADIATIPPEIIEKMLKHNLTDAGIKKFDEDWEKLKKELGK